MGEIDTILKITSQVPAVVQKQPTLQKILAMIHTINGDHEQALPYLANLVENPAVSKESMVQRMAMGCMYQLGGIPETQVDFSTLVAQPAQDTYISPQSTWLIVPEGRKARPAVFAACDDRYFFEHVLALVYSVHATNAGMLDVHLHLYNPNPSVTARVQQLKAQLPALNITATAETFHAPSPLALDVEYTCRRFMAASHVLQTLDIRC